MADLGIHQFKYSLLPHSGIWGDETQAAAYALNDPVIIYNNNSLGKGSSSENFSNELTQPLISVNSPNIIIETIKQAENGEGLVIRLFESRRMRGSVTLRSIFPIKAAWETDLLEENQTQCTLIDGQIILDFKPFEIKTLRILFH